MKPSKRTFPWGLTELVIAIRWAALCLSLLAMLMFAGSPTKREIIAGAVLALYAVLRTVWPVRLDASLLSGRAPSSRSTVLVEVCGEVALCVVVVLFTGTVESPFIISLGAAVFLAGLRVPASALAVACVASILGLAIAGLTGTLSHTVASQGIERAAVLGALAMLASYSDWLLRLGMREEAGELRRLRNLVEVNHLLLELHTRAASQPASLSLKAAMANTVTRLRGLLHPDAVALFLADPTADGGLLEVTVAEGVALPSTMHRSDLPEAMNAAMGSLGPVLRTQLAEREGVAAGAVSGIYVALWARDTLLGLLAAERVSNSEPFSEADAELVASVARHAGLAIDNARWFHRLRTLGAEEERGRIAREMHDRLGQSLAFVALSLDRLAIESNGLAQPGTGSEGAQEMAAELEGLAGEVRRATREVRSKLSDLRAELGEEGQLSDLLAGLLARVEQRSGIVTKLDADGGSSLPPVTEREVARIAQEAINNAERHSGARHIYVRWHCDHVEAELEVADDGRGLAPNAPLRSDAFGILGMRERADAIGAKFGIVSPPGQGTKVRLHLGQPVTSSGGVII